MNDAVYQTLRSFANKPVFLPESEWQFHKSKDEARATLDKQFGTRECMFRFAKGGFSVGVVEAIRILGGKYQDSWGITLMPTEWQ